MSGPYTGACFCGAVELRVTGQPDAMGYCHCRSCRSWSGGPVNAFSLWQPKAVEVTKGAEHIGTYAKTPMSERQFCKLCGGHLMARHPPLQIIDVFAATIPDLPFVPAVHLNYAETVLPMRDGLPKMRDFPAEVGGSGETVPE
ncbi:GFA family protein [Pseudoroseomonas wenyumeiae]|uniref:GFA family protein n=1 Tax=Teichococcus wenyumeiae TaxID=2478470 RepID=A0A3A9J7C0_9PROT|nr:GFA family protein [Pseudoroseomonas wenyumeiae]RKK03127.1 GFA family protein [Pseudoroseomonas wenyumeiae]RMI24737.1 GFA family protein [Pseudoroseomonas wenyumeiae]